MRFVKRRGLSPVIATVLLISLALVLSVIVFLWARSFIGEQIEKEGQKVELVCEQVSFNAEAIALDSTLAVVNTGSVPLYAVEIRTESRGEISEVAETPSGQSIGPGETATFSLPSEINAGEKIIVVPILLGESKEKKDFVPHICDADYGVKTTVK